MFSMSGNLISFDRFKDTEKTKKIAMMNAATGGPNSGFEIAGLDAFKDGSLTDEFPEMKDDINLIVSTEHFVSRLVDFRQRVLASRGMSRSMAVELLELVPSLESHTSPMHFSEEITAIGAETSLEAIDIKLWAIIAAAIAFVAGLIYKFTEWLRGGSSGGGSGSVATTAEEGRDGVKETEKKIDEQVQTVEEVIAVVKDVPSETITVEIPAVTDHQAIERSHMPEALKEEIIAQTKPLGTGTPPAPDATVSVTFSVDELLNSITEGKTVHDYIMNPSPYARIVYGERSRGLEFIVKSFNNYGLFSQLLLGKLDIMEDMIRDMETPGHSEDARTAQRFTGNINALQGKGEADLMKLGHEPLESYSAWASRLREYVDEAADIRVSFKDVSTMLAAYQLGQKRLAEVRWENLIAIFDAVEKAEPILKKAHDTVGKISTDSELSKGPEAGVRAKTLLEAIRLMQSELAGLMSVYAVISKIYHEVSVHGAKIVSVITSNAREIIHFYNRFDIPVPENISKLVEDLVEQNETMTENVAPVRFVSLKGRNVIISVDGQDINQNSDIDRIATEQELKNLTGQTPASSSAGDSPFDDPKHQGGITTS